MEIKKEEIAWRKIQRSKKFLNAFRGMKVFWVTTDNLKLHLFTALAVIFFGFYFSISSLEWLAIIFAIGLVIISEAFNTAIEIDIDLTSPDYHPFARDTKDVSAAAVLLSVFLAIIIGCIVFLPKFIIIFS